MPKHYISLVLYGLFIAPLCSQYFVAAIFALNRRLATSSKNLTYCDRRLQIERSPIKSVKIVMRLLIKCFTCGSICWRMCTSVTIDVYLCLLSQKNKK